MHDRRRASESVRMSLGPETTREDVHFAVEAWRKVLTRFA
jgi:cysteine sulfinate desulfinase/cysteine desulfurase-like protein